MENLKLNKRNKILILLVVILMITSCSNKSFGRVIDTGSTFVTYKGENEKEISYGKVKFKLEQYHIISKTEKDGYVEFYCKLDKGEKEDLKSKTYKIRRYDKGDIVTFEDAKKYLDKTAEYDRLGNYQDIKDESGITKMYIATSEVEEINYYICCYKDETYIIETNEDDLSYYLVSCHLRDFLINILYMDKIGKPGKVEKKVIENVFIQANKAEYEIYSNEDVLEYTAKLNIKELKKGNQRYQYSYKIYDSNNKKLQEIKWKSIEKYYPNFMDMNQDGSVDLQITVDEAINYAINEFYLWKEGKQSYEKVICDETLSDIKVCDGYILNYVRAGAKGYIVEKLVWKGNELIKVSEELIMPDDE